MASASIGQKTKSHLITLPAGNIASMPDRVPHNTHPLKIDIQNLAEDLDLTSWLPAGLSDGAEVSVRKLDDTKHRIVFTDSAGILYNFVGKRGEVITFIYLKKQNILSVK